MNAAKRRNIMTTAIIILIVVVVLIIYKFNNLNYNIDNKVLNYNLTNKNDRNAYIDYLKNYVYPEKLRSFVNNDYINFDQYTNEADGNIVVEQLEFNGYKRLFNSMFDKDRTNFDDCPVTEKFKEKFKTNLFDYYNLSKSEDCQKICSLYCQEKDIKVEVFGNFKNTEPTYWTTHHFKYTLDKDGNVDDVTFDYTE
jgi:hypothetical protein